jgi:hypothetical protein
MLQLHRGQADREGWTMLDASPINIFVFIQPRFR